MQAHVLEHKEERGPVGLRNSLGGNSLQGYSSTCRVLLLRGAASVALALGLALGVAAPSSAPETEIKGGYTQNSIQDASLDIMEKWANANNVKLTRVPMAYSVFMEKV